MTTIVLCATQRCGSTMICEDMRNTGVLGNPEEWFVSWSPDKSAVDWRRAFSGVLQRATGSNGVRAVKVMADQLPAIEQCLTGETELDPQGLFPTFADSFRGAHFVWLVRRDVVAQATSRVMSRQTGINHATASPLDDHFAGNLVKGLDLDGYNVGTRYRFEDIASEVTSIVLENLVWERFFAKHELIAHPLTYELVSADSELMHLNTLAELASVELPAKRPRRMIKMANARNDAWNDLFMRDALTRRFKL